MLRTRRVHQKMGCDPLSLDFQQMRILHGPCEGSFHCRSHEVWLVGRSCNAAYVRLWRTGSPELLVPVGCPASAPTPGVGEIRTRSPSRSGIQQSRRRGFDSPRRVSRRPSATLVLTGPLRARQRALVSAERQFTCLSPRNQ